MKCSDIDELRKCRIGITKDCVLYHNYRIQHINPAHYTKFAYIGKNSLRQRIKLLEKEIADLDEKQKPLQDVVKEAERVLTLEYLSSGVLRLSGMEAGYGFLPRQGEPEEASGSEA